MKKNKQRRIALVAERWSGYSRRFIEGVARFSTEHENWAIELHDSIGFEGADIRSFDGFICRLPSEQLALRLAKLGRPVVDSLHIRRFDTFVSVTSDILEVSRLAAEHFISRRHTTFAYCGFDNRTYSSARAEAFAEVLRKHGFTVNTYHAPMSAARHIDHFNRFGTPLTIPDARSLLSWLKRLPKPSAVFCCNDRRAAQVLQLCREEGISIPSELSICGVDNDPIFCGFATPRLTSIDPDAEGVGFRAAQTLSGMFGEHLDGRPHPGAVISVPPKGLIARASTAVFPVEPVWLSDALVYIRAHTGDNLTADDIYRHLGLSHSTVNSMFRKKLGTTVQQEIALARIETAKRLLKETDLKITQIAHKSGFGSAEYLCHCFAQTCGCSPSAFRA